MEVGSICGKSTFVLVLILGSHSRSSPGRSARIHGCLHGDSGCSFAVHHFVNRACYEFVHSVVDNATVSSPANKIQTPGRDRAAGRGRRHKSGGVYCYDKRVHWHHDGLSLCGYCGPTVDTIRLS